jgi:hypothetical protein
VTAWQAVQAAVAALAAYAIGTGIEAAGNETAARRRYLGPPEQG